jgi:hypothetical protein
MLTDSKSFFDTQTQQYSLQHICQQLSTSSKVLMSTAEGSIFCATLVPSSPTSALGNLLTHLQAALSSFLGSSELCQYTELIKPTLHGLSNHKLNLSIHLDFVALLLFMPTDQQREVVNRTMNTMGQNLETTTVISSVSMVISHCEQI